MKNKIILILRLVTAVILLQTLYFKFSGASESIQIFSTLGVEPWGRWFTGVSELIASLLLLIPATQIMLGAILSHVFVLGIVVQNDGGVLFALAVIVFVCSLVIVSLQTDKLKELNERARKLIAK
jgi:uncharacterized membrane protein YphA (DoxX/SURF4 family)